MQYKKNIGNILFTIFIFIIILIACIFLRNIILMITKNQNIMHIKQNLKEIMLNIIKIKVIN